MLAEPRSRTTFPGGRGTGRPNRAPTSLCGGYLWEACASSPSWHVRPWGIRFFQQPLRPGSGDAFRTKFRTPSPPFNMIKRDCEASGLFPTEPPETGGHTPDPLELKIVGYLRFLATGAQVDAHEEGLAWPGPPCKSSTFPSPNGSLASTTTSGFAIRKPRS